MEINPFDLTPTDKQSDIFKVVFDYYTPRSHFIIFPRDVNVEVHKKLDYNELKREEKTELIRVASEIVSKYLKLPATLSVHRGSWYSTKKNFHAHVCADVDEYIKVFKDKQGQIPDWPNAKYVNKNWEKSKDPTKYEVNVRGYPFETFFEKEIQEIEQLSSKDKDKKKPTDSASSESEYEYEGFTVLYHSNEPRVGFAENKFSEEDYLKVLEAMNKYAWKNNLTDINSEDDNEGCHLCVVFDDLKHGFDVKVGLVLQGYLQLSGPKYYSDLCPENMKESWLTEFNKLGIKGDYKVYT